MERHTIIGHRDNALALSLDTRRRHMAVIGATGSGKSSLFLNVFKQDAERGDGLLYIDPLGDDAERALGLIPKTRANQVCYLNFADRDHPVGLNVLEDVAPDDRELHVDNIVSTMRGMWKDSWGARMDEILRHSLRALIETPNASLILLPRFLTDDEFRTKIVGRVSNPLTQAFFITRFDEWKTQYQDEAVNPVLNKCEQFLFSPLVRNVLGQARSTVHFSQQMSRKRIVIANLAKGVIGETNAHLIGGLLIALVQAAGLQRLQLPADQHHPFHVLIDEGHDFAVDKIPNLYSQARHFGVTLALATQFLKGLPEKTEHAMRTNPATLVCFRPGAEDATLLAPEFDRLHQSFNPAALLQLGRGEAVIRIAGEEVRRLQLPPPPTGSGYAELIREQSRRHYGRLRGTVQTMIDSVLTNALPKGREKR